MVQGNAADGTKPGLIGREGYEVLQMYRQVKGKAGTGTFGLKVLKRSQGVPPFRSDLSQSQILTAKLGPQRVHPDKYLGDLFIGLVALQNMDTVAVIFDISQLF